MKNTDIGNISLHSVSLQGYNKSHLTEQAVRYLYEINRHVFYLKGMCYI